MKGRAIPERVRRSLALRAGCTPGERLTGVPCHYCHKCVGNITWHRLSSGRVGMWVSINGLDIDHLHPFFLGGESTEENVVLACPNCNRSKGWRRTREEMIELARERKAA